VKNAEIVKKFDEGQIMMQGAYWAGRIEPISVRSQTPGGPRRTAYIHHETVMGAKGPVVVSRFLRDDEDPATIRFPIAKMTKVVVEIQKMEMQNGIPFLTGTVSPVE